MKKLMFAVAAVAAGVCCADVSSTNVVGYQKPAVLGDGEFAIVTPTFNAIGGKYKISDIAVVDAEGIGGVGGEFVQKMNADGSWGQDYYYLTEDGAGCETGWYKDSWGVEAVTDEDTLEKGEALIVTAEAGFSLQFAGQVNAEATDIPLEDSGFWLAGNATPVPVKIADIQVLGAESIGGVGGEFFQKMNADGTWGQDYYFLTEDGAGCETGWYKDSWGVEAVTDEDVLLPGEAAVVTAETGFTLRIPSALK